MTQTDPRVDEPGPLVSLNVVAMDSTGPGDDVSDTLDDYLESLAGIDRDIRGARCEWVCYGYDMKTCKSFCHGYVT